MKRNVSVVRFKFRYNILISGKILKEMPGSVVSGTRCIKTACQYSSFLFQEEMEGKSKRNGFMFYEVQTS